jgi:hypothetical protein
MGGGVESVEVEEEWEEWALEGAGRVFLGVAAGSLSERKSGSSSEAADSDQVDDLALIMRSLKQTKKEEGGKQRNKRMRESVGVCVCYVFCEGGCF